MRFSKVYESLLESLLNEALTNIDRDVDNIYNAFFAHIINGIHNGSIASIIEFRRAARDIDISMRDLVQRGIIVDERLKQVAREQNPTFHIHDFLRGNAYDPLSNKVHLSLVDVIPDVMEPIGWDVDRIGDALPQHQVMNFKQELTPQRMKGSINHELAHLMDDFFNNRRITNIFQDESGKRRAADDIYHRKTQGRGDPYLTNYEIQALIHNIHQAKREISPTRWDGMTFEDMLEYLPSLKNISVRFKNMGVYDGWKRDMLERMARENLLGRTMKYRGNINTG